MLAQTNEAIEYRVSPVFSWNFFETRREDRYIINRGGTRSSKTYSICQIIANWLIFGKCYNDQEKADTEGAFSVVRKTLPALRSTAIRDIKKILLSRGHWKYVKFNRTVSGDEGAITMKFKGRYIEFFSVDNPDKARSRSRKHLYCLEANELTWEDFKQLQMRTEGKIFLCFNPDNPDIWIKTKLEDERAALKNDVKVFVSTYHHNPFITDVQYEELELLKEVDPEYYQVFGKGEYGRVSGLVFSNVEIVKSIPSYVDKFIYGIDWGFNDPMTLIKIGLDDPNIWIEELFFESFKLPSDLAAYMKKIGIPSNAAIYCDTNPGNRQEIKKAGFPRIKSFYKPKGSILAGIQKLKRYNLLLTYDSSNTRSEFRKYKYLEKKQAIEASVQYEEDPIDLYNHSIDAIRGAVFTHTFKGKSGGKSIMSSGTTLNSADR